jgi:rare lipoprotein A
VRRSFRPGLLLVLAGLAVAACGGKPGPRTAGTPPPRGIDVSDDTAAVARDAARLGSWPVKIGKPYQVAGVTYYPADDRTYREEGIASWYGPGFHGGSTANGERYDQDDLTAAHRTLPMPSWVEVENLDNGRKLTVRINDRGPFAKGRIIDLSRKAAQLLGVDRAGTARVRLRRVFPDRLEDQKAPPLPPVVVATAQTPPVQAVAIPPVERSSVRNAGGWLVQVAALGDPGRVAWLKGFLASFGPVVTDVAPGGLTRVRLGPYAAEHLASAALAQVRSAGYGEARLIPPTNSR